MESKTITSSSQIETKSKEPINTDLKKNPGCVLALFSALNPINIYNKILKEKEAKKEQIKKAELRKQQEIKRQQLEKEKKFELYKDFVNGEVKSLVSIFRVRIEKDNNQIESRNKTCPICGSKNVVNRIGNTTGSVHGEVQGSGFVTGGLFFTHGSSRVHGSVDGKTETLPVSHCKNCSNEWTQTSKKSTFDNDIIKKHISSDASSLIFYIKEYLKGEYTDILIDDEKDREEKAFNQLLYKNRRYLNLFKGISIETLAYLYSVSKSEYCFINKNYQYKFPKNIEDVLKKLGFKYGFKDQ